MKSAIAIGFFVLLVVSTASLHAEKTSKNDGRLKWALEKFPAADTDENGTLTASEATAYLDKVKGSLGELLNPGELRPTHADIAYGEHERHKLDLYLAPSDEQTPLLVYIHGGGFRGGDKKHVGRNGGLIVHECRSQGISVASINYRFRHQASMPDILRDCARAIQFLRYQAGAYNIDKSRILAMGMSAGAGSALWLAARDDLADRKSEDPVLRESSRICAACCISGQFSYDITTWAKLIGPAPRGFNPDREIASFRPAKGDRQAARRDVHMIDHLSNDDPPLFLSSSGTLGPAKNVGHYLHHPKHSLLIKERCDREGVDCVVVLPDAKHPKSHSGNAQLAMRSFVMKHLGRVGPK